MKDAAPRTEGLSYRRDIDGLRAVAVLLVLADHLRTRATGGYVGVDVFFVISGYLISAHILAEQRAGRFRLVDFYERRVRRILPGLLAMLLVTSALAWRFLLPQETLEFGRSMVAALLSCSNMLFWGQAGYFDTPSALKPLLHTWSLGVEEQFYIVFPLLIVLVRRWLPNRLKAVIWVAAAVSFAWACREVQLGSSAAFYIAPLRAWELLIGTVAAEGLLPVARSAIQRNVFATVGIALIVIPAFAFDARTPFPGFAALPACAGAVIVIGAGETGTSFIGRVLSWRPIVFIGLISYSLYLWHWPIIVFWMRSRMRAEDAAITPREKLLLGGASLLAGAISWLLVETPFRRGRLRPGRSVLYVVSGSASACVVLLSGVMIVTHGLPSRYSAEAVQIASYSSNDLRSDWRTGVCFLSPPSTMEQFDAQTCLPEIVGRPEVLLLGDSMAAQLYPGLRQVFPELTIAQANSADCRPFVTPEPDMLPGYAANCRAMLTMIFGEYLTHHHPAVVLLAASWNRGDLPALGQTIAWLKQRDLEPVVVGPVPEYDAALPRLLAFGMRTRVPSVLLREHTISWPAELDRTMAREAALNWNVRYISVFQDLCRTQREAAIPESGDGCPALAAPGVPLQFDFHHFTEQGSVLFAQAIRARHQLP